MNIAFCIGNGISREKFDLNKLKDIGPIYGCNRLIETFDIDNTIVVDNSTLIDLVAKGYNRKTNIYTRKRWHRLVEADNVHYLEDPIKEPIHRWDMESQWGSGTHALNLAANNGSEIIVMLGYDLYNAGFSPNCWIYQIDKCLELHPDTQFVQIQEDGWECPDTWTHSNFLMDNFKGLKQLLKDIK